MSFKLRNTLILLVIALITLGIAFYLFVIYFPGVFEEMEQELARLEQAIRQIPEREEYNQKLQEQVKQKYASLAKLDKTIQSEIDLAEIFDYVDHIQDRFGNFRFNLRNGETQATDLYGYLEFNLTGEGTFTALHNFLNAIEHGPRILIIDKLEMRGVENAPSGDDVDEPLLTVPFEFQFRAPFADVAELPPLEKTLADVRAPDMPNIYYPIIAKNLPPNLEGLVEVERAELRAIFPGKAVVADAEGDIHVLATGDEVYLGYLTKVNAEDNTAEFTLNKGGIVEKFTMKLGF